MKWLISNIIIASVSLCAADVYVDPQTGLEWQDNDDAKILTKSWAEAINYCENLTLGGYDDWRLPNKNELLSIVDFAKSPSVVSGIFNIKTDHYWTSTTKLQGSTHAFTIYFQNGRMYPYEKRFNLFVRCVRGGLDEAGGEPGVMVTQGDVTNSESVSPDSDMGEE